MLPRTVKHQSDSVIIPLASRLLGPFESSFRTFDATDYQPIGKDVCRWYLLYVHIVLVSLFSIHFFIDRNSLKSWIFLTSDNRCQENDLWSVYRCHWQFRSCYWGKLQLLHVLKMYRSRSSSLFTEMYWGVSRVRWGPSYLLSTEDRESGLVVPCSMMILSH